MSEEEIKKPERPFYAPGWYKDLSNEEYHGSFGFSSSNLKKLCERTPAHLKYESRHPREATANMKMGTLVHTLVLEPEAFEREYIIEPQGLEKPTQANFESKNPKPQTVAKINRWLAWEKESEGRQTLKQELYDQARFMADSVLNHPIASVLLQDVISESSIYWWYKNRDPDDETEYRIMAKVRPDAISIAHDCLIDLKTTTDASYTGFQKSVMYFYYHLSAAMYLDGVNQCKVLLEEMRKFAYTSFVFICVENQPPYECAVYELDKRALEIGKQLYRRAMLNLHRGKENNWPGYPEDIRILELPSWAERLYTV